MEDQSYHELRHRVKMLALRLGLLDQYSDLAQDSYIWMCQKLQQNPNFPWQDKLYSFVRHWKSRYFKIRNREIPCADIAAPMDMYSEDDIIEKIDLDTFISKQDPRIQRLMCLKIEGVLTNKQIAEVLGVSSRTIYRDLKKIRLSYRREQCN